MTDSDQGSGPSDTSPGVTYADFGDRLAAEVPWLAPAIERERQSAGEELPYMIMALVFEPLLKRPEFDAHSGAGEAVPHECRAQDLVRWVEMMASSDDDDVVNLMGIEIFEGTKPDILDRFDWGPRTREVLAAYPPW